MHHLPRFLGHSRRRKDMDSKQRARGPKLERRLAQKNIDYEPSTSSSSSRASEETTAALRSRSLDLSPDRTSFRVQGIDGEFDLICKSLGLSVEDFAIPLDAWEARKARSSSDLLPRSRLRFLESSNADCTTPQTENGGANELSDEFADSVRLRDVDRGQGEIVELNVCPYVNEIQNDLPESVGRPIDFQSSRCGGGGIKGVRPPFLAPPPSMSISLPVIDDTCSTWDILKSFAPDNGGGTFCVREVIYSDDEEDEEIGKAEEVNGPRRGETAVLSESCSFTTSSNDDDSSSTTTTDISPNGRFRRIISYWEKGDLLGRGSFGSVYEGIADGGFFFAVKEVSLLDQGEQGRQSVYQLEQEIALLSQFEHENIVRYYGTDKDDSKLYIFLELVNKGSLLNLYQKYYLRDSQVFSYTRQILHGLKYLHDKNVVHRDIKCANILVDANGSVKLADFGLAKATKLNDVKSCKGTAFWMAPEVVNRRSQGYGLPADIWSLGCTVLEMLTRQIPYSHLECMQALFRIGKGEPPPVPDSLSKDAQDFILKCLQVNPSSRPTASQLLDHPFVHRPLLTASGSESPYHSAQRV